MEEWIKSNIKTKHCKASRRLKRKKNATITKYIKDITMYPICLHFISSSMTLTKIPPLPVILTVISPPPMFLTWNPALSVILIEVSPPPMSLTRNQPSPVILTAISPSPLFLTRIPPSSVTSKRRQLHHGGTLSSPVENAKLQQNTSRNALTYINSV